MFTVLLFVLSVSPMSTSMPQVRRRRNAVRRLHRRQADDMVVPFDWSLRVRDGSTGTGTPADCNSLPTLSVYPR